jgi:hypothetical protein
VFVVVNLTRTLAPYSRAKLSTSTVFAAVCAAVEQVPYGRVKVYIELPYSKELITFAIYFISLLFHIDL